MNFDDNGQLYVNVNSFSNDNVWNAKYRHRVVSLKLYVSPPFYFGGVFFFVFFSRPFFQPPSILPISCNWVDSAVYFSSFIHLFSQAICKKNLTPSSLEIAIIRRDILVSVGRYIEMKMFSSSARK